MKNNTRIPTLHVVADCIPLAYYRAMKAVWENGVEIRTEYDRKDSDGNYIDPPSRDARVLIEITDPLNEPRFPPVSFCEIGVYIAEMLGIKDHFVVPVERLMDKDLTAREWPYTYHQRLFSYPKNNTGVNQMFMAMQRISETPHSRRAVATTAMPNVDCYLKEDIPCLREIQLRCLEDGNQQYLNMNSFWRSRDLYKAWCDNVIAMTFLQKKIAQWLYNIDSKKRRVGSYADYSGSLHIYGQDFVSVGGDKENGIKSFFDNFDEETILKRSLTSEQARDLLIIPQLEELLTKKKIEEWKFPNYIVEDIEYLLHDFEKGYLP